jgi:hypothetical protein
MSEEIALGQREVTADMSVDTLTAEEKELIMSCAFAMMKDNVAKSGVKTINACLGSLGLLENKVEDATPSVESTETPVEEVQS